MPFIKPENALKRAEEFIDVGKKKRALDTLYEVIRSKKHRTWQKIHEQIMKNYLTLCVDLKESHMAKDGLHQYKTICQSVNAKSLEDVITGFLAQAEEKAEKAKKDACSAANAANLLTDVDDLEYINSPESVLLKAVSGESSQDRADRDLLAPWLKFVWESYKQCLDLLKNNNKVEALYQQVAKQAFAFCVKYQRKTEFRKLCETLRQHMFQGHKYSNQTQTSIDMSKPETQNNHLETRMLQLNNAISMELWQEAYKAVEDIYALMSMSKTKPKPGQMYNYYSKLSLIFWKAGNQLFHAATLQKLYVLLKEQKKTITQEELTKISTRQLLATLAIPITPNRSLIDECLDQDEVTLEKLKRLSSLLNLQQPPTRFTLLKDLAKYNVVQHVFPEVRDLYKCLEVEFNPLKLSERVNKCLDYLESRPDAQNENYAQYIHAIKEITVTRLLKQISQIYTTIEIKRFLQLAPKGIESFSLEKIIVDSGKQLDLQVRINHQTKSLHFGNDLYVSQRDDLQEGPSIQSMPSEQIRTQLINMSQALQQAQHLIAGPENKSKLGELAQSIANVYRQTCDKHHIELLKRKQFIEKQKEIYENLAVERERIKNEEKRLKQEEKDLKMNKFASIREGRDPAFGYDDELSRQRAIAAANEKQDDEINRQIEQANKERRELVEKMKKEEKKYDHLVRACHENEIALIERFSETDAEKRKVFWDEKEIERIENLKEEMRVQAENKERLMRMSADKDAFLSLIHAARKAEYEKKIEDFKVKLAAAREAKLRERKEKRKTDRRNAFYRAIEEKKRKEEEERRAKEDEEKRRKQNEQAEKQRKREQEIEEKLRASELAKQQQTQQQQQSAGGGGGDEKQQSSSSAAGAGVYRPKQAGGAGFAGRVDRPTEGGGESSWRRAAGAAPSGGDEPQRDNWRRDDRSDQRQQEGGDRRRILDDEGSSNRREFGGRSGGGDRGERGDFGNRGGDRGERGERGDFGNRGGDRGERGERGDFGNRGGDRGERGERGDFGNRGGDRGERGERGDFGNRGGDRGDRGERGGERGDFGNRGGDRGERGDFGNRGGDRGERGGEREGGGRDFRDRDGRPSGGRGGYHGGGDRKPGGPPRSGGGFGSGSGGAGADSSDNWRSGPR